MGTPGTLPTGPWGPGLCAAVCSSCCPLGPGPRARRHHLQPPRGCRRWIRSIVFSWDPSGPCLPGSPMAGSLPGSPRAGPTASPDTQPTAASSQGSPCAPGNPHIRLESAALRPGEGLLHCLPAPASAEQRPPGAGRPRAAQSEPPTNSPAVCKHAPSAPAWIFAAFSFLCLPGPFPREVTSGLDCCSCVWGPRSCRTLSRRHPGLAPGWTRGRWHSPPWLCLPASPEPCGRARASALRIPGGTGVDSVQPSQSHVGVIYFHCCFPIYAYLRSEGPSPAELLRRQ